MSYFLYLSDGDLNGISMYSIGNYGNLTPLYPSKVASGNTPTNIETVSINSINYAYTVNGESNTISSYSILRNGQLIPLNNGTTQTDIDPHYISISQNNNLNYLYSINASSETISMYSIGTMGQLTQLTPGTISTGKKSFSSNIVKVNGMDYMYVTNIENDSVSMYSVQANGQLLPLTNATISTRVSPQYISSININNVNYVYVTHISDSTISMYSIENNGQLIPLIPYNVSVGEGSVSYLTIATTTINNKNYAYAPNYKQNTVSVYSIANNGQLDLIPMSTVPTGTNPFEVEIGSINGVTYAYISNDTGYSMSMYSISSDGLLTPLSPSSIITGNGSNEASNYMKFISIPSPLPISNICFLGHTLIQTDQGYVPIYKIKHNIHTISGKKIVDVTKTKTKDPHLVSFKKNALGPNVPMEKTIMSTDHKILLNGTLTEAKKFVGKFAGVTYVKYNGEILYNILMEDYSIIKANNLTCETLHPDNMIAKLYTCNSKFSVDERDNIVFQLEDCINKKNTDKYKQIMKKI